MVWSALDLFVFCEAFRILSHITIHLAPMHYPQPAARKAKNTLGFPTLLPGCRHSPCHGLLVGLVIIL